MKRTTSLTISAAALVLCLQAMPAQAQSPRTFVSGTGNDASATCSRAAPCRSFAVAITRTDVFGEIVVLDPAGYGPVRITKSISIINDGVGEAGIRSAPDGVGIDIVADPKAVITLRGLTVDGGSLGTFGIVFNTGAVLNIQNCMIRHHRDIGLWFAANASTNLSVSNTLLSNNGGGGIVVRPSGAGTVKAVFNRVEAYNNGSLVRTEGVKAGIEIDGSASTGTVDATIADSVSANNTRGFFVDSAFGQARTSVMLLRSVAANNDVGVLVQLPQAIVRSARSTITGNATAWSVTGGGVFQTYGDNYIDGNTVDGGLPPTIPTR
jgi:hypothetical protein